MASSDDAIHPQYDWAASAGSHSWHPALRPHTIDLASGVPGTKRSANEERNTTPSHVSDRAPYTDTPREGFGDERLEEEEAAIFQSDEAAQERGESLQNSTLQIDTSLVAPVAVPSSQEAGHAFEPPSENYEHQAELMDLGSAQSESAAAPLMADEEPPPVTAQVEEVPVLDMLNEEQDQSSELEHVPAADFAVASEAEEHTAIADNPPIANTERGYEWPSAGDDSEYTDLLGGRDMDTNAPSEHKQSQAPEAGSYSQDVDSAEDTTYEDLLGVEALSSALLTTNVVEEAGQVGNDDEVLLPDDDDDGTEDDLAAAFQAALDLGDEDLLETPNDDMDPSAFFGDDEDLLADDDFLTDDVLNPGDSASRSTGPAGQNRYAPSSVSSSERQMPNPYAPSSTQFAAAAVGRPGSTPETGLYDIYASSRGPAPAESTARPAAAHAQSFADKAKGGYQSPYDLPMEVVKTRRRPPPQDTGSSGPVAPPRSSSSIGTQSDLAPHFVASTPSFSSQAPPQRSAVSVPPTASSGIVPARSTPKSNDGFFAELPVASKPRSRPSGTGTTPLNQPPPNPLPVTGPPLHPTQPAYQPNLPHGGLQHPPQPAPPSNTSKPSGAFGLELRQPERMPLLPDVPNIPPSQSPPIAPSNASRYSPNSQIQWAAPPVNRYSPAPASQPTQTQAKSRYAAAPVTAPAHAFAPRTSSPLAYQKERSQTGMIIASELYRRETMSPPSNIGQAPIRGSPDRATKYAPSAQNQVSPQRLAQAQRPQSYSGAAVPSNVARTTSFLAAQPRQAHGPALPHRRTLSREMSLVQPQDERAQDPLQRWKDSPIFNWHSAGSVMYTFPKHSSVFIGGHGSHSLTPTPGVIHIEPVDQFLPLDDRNGSFPGPLAARSKGKKKDVLSWLAAKITDLEQLARASKDDPNIAPDIRKRRQEKDLLWKLVKVLVEHDGSLDGNNKSSEIVRELLLPDLSQLSAVSDLQTPTTSSVAAEGFDRSAVLQLRAALLEGQRERAVWLAEEKKLWGHAMLIASTMGPATWKQIVQSFVRSQVKTVGSDTRSLAYLYQVFGGNSEECIDELVPASARAGFQMMSKDQSGAVRDPLEGLDQWRETLALIVGNRTANDGASILALGKLLSDYGRAEAAHSCFLFARSMVKHTGPDASDAHFVLLGTSTQDENFGHDLDSILLTEVYEWACSLSAPSTTPPYAAHFQAFKLIHAQMLAVHGLKAKAQAYCDHITTAFTSTTKPSPYYHPVFTQSVAELSAFLQHTYAGKGGLFSKPSMNKVSSGAASWFTKFVSGEDDQELKQQGPGSEAGSGPFGGVQKTPPISRTTSSADLYNPMMAGFSPAGPFAAQTPPSALNAAPQGTSAQYAPPSTQGHYAPSHVIPQTPGARSLPEAPQAPNRYAPNRSTPLSNQTSSSALSPAFTPDGSVHTISSGEHQPSHAYTYSAGSSEATGNNRYAPPSARDQSYNTQSHPSPGGYAPVFGHGSHQPYPSTEAATPASLRNDFQSQESSALSDTISARPEAHYNALTDDGYAEQSSMGFGEGLHGAQEQVVPQSPAEHAPNGYTSSNAFRPADSYGAYQPHQSQGAGYQDLSTTYQVSPQDSYQAPSNTYQPYEPDVAAPEESEPAKKKSMLEDDDDDELLKRAEALKRQQKSQADRDADDAFRKAAEADAARDKGGDKKAGWLGGWFGGKKEKDAAPGPIRAKLGEESSFYYDEQLKKWVNKKGGSNASTPSAPTPPPPRGLPSRIVSAASMGPPSGPPSRVSSAGSMPPMRASLGAGPTSNPAMPSSGPPSRAGTPASQGTLPLAANGNASGPPSRPSTGLSNATDLDDILGGPPGAKKAGGTLRGKKRGGRYVDVMAK